jgi:hypothetical protein
MRADKKIRKETLGAFKTDEVSQNPSRSVEMFTNQERL